MNRHREEELSRACKSRDGRVASRALAVRMVLVKDKTVAETADNMDRCPDWVSKWVARFEQGGVEGLSDLPRSGRRPLVDRDTMKGIIDEMLPVLVPVELQQEIRRATGVNMHITNVRRIMRRSGLSVKRATGFHVNRAGKKEVSDWQSTINQRISRLSNLGFTVMMQDEAFFARDDWHGRRGWNKTGSPLLVPYTGDISSVGMYGAITTGGMQMFRTADAVNAETFVRYLRQLRCRFGRIAVIVDRSRVHASSRVRRFVDQDPDVRLIFLPKGSPYLNAVEEIWHQTKAAVMVSKYYENKKEMKHALSEFLRTSRFKLDLVRYAHRKPVPTDFCS